MISRFKKLNGWQRLFVLLSFVWFGVYSCYFYSAPLFLNDSAYFEESLPRPEIKKSEDGGHPVNATELIALIRSANTYKTSDGANHEVFGTFTKEQLNEAEAISKVRVREFNLSRLADLVVNFFKIAILPIALLYFLGSMVAWVISGFMKKAP